ncbi:aryl-alcohol dehydrogenase-like predicted oxidoreductase [Kineococcus radiotolerans]|uniref:Aryl-alcohol dehydrogenase-like predicted oxidoreductase n=1 Tax=Kineococcus radiotolerans TaxID=131568 RepID=A0A7W4TMJ0_KINRA|nr:aldo/keto reductase [Kineococcus radiotolerans]MBB2901688.1 aryl-alcohol dehydrogenase-like predicted oxidoreductase [Kineococcus radiotolerans]
MDHTHLGSTGLTVSRIVLGCMSFGDGSEQQTWTLDAEGAEPVFRAAVELGVTFWDTANVYGRGSSERVTGEAIRKYTRREDVVLATKVFGEMGPGPGQSGLSRRAVLEQVDASLQRLGTDWIDLYQIHRFDPTTPVEETMEALHDVVKAGKVRYLGASSMWAWQFAKLQTAADLGGWTRFVSMQNQYSLAQREDEREMFPLLADQGVGSIPWGPLQAGKMARPWNEQNTARAGDEPQTDPKGNPVRLDSDRGIVDAIERIAGERGVSMAQVALAWVLRNPVVDAPIVGATKVHHLHDAVAALDLELTAEEVAALEEHYVPRQPTFF